MIGYRHAAAISVSMAFALPSLSSAQDAGAVPGLDLPSFDVAVEVDVPVDPSFDPPAFDGPGFDASLSIESDVFDIEVTVQLAPGDPVPDVDVTLRPCCRPPPPPPPCHPPLVC